MRSNFTGWQNQVALITGGSSGIGLAASKLLVSEGAHVFLVARRVEPLNEALKILEEVRCYPSQCIRFFSADVSKAEESAAAVDFVANQAGPPNLIINSAGVVHPGYAKDLDLEHFRWMMETNYFGTINIIKAALPGMIARGSGRIINISSAASFLGVIGYSAYAASKYALNGFSEALRAELRPLGIQVSLAFPPDTDTPQLAYETPLRPVETKALAGAMRPLPAETVAQRILAQAAAGKFLIFPSFDNKFFFWLTRWLGVAVHPLADIITDRARRKAYGRDRGTG